MAYLGGVVSLEREREHSKLRGREGEPVLSISHIQQAWATE
jgi:hypothetical protein